MNFDCTRCSNVHGDCILCFHSDHELQSRLLLNRRLVSLYAFDGGPRDLRFSTQKNKLVCTARNVRSRASTLQLALTRSFCLVACTQREAGWDNSRPAWGNFIPEYGTPGTHACVGQIEEHIKRPVTVSTWRARDHRKKQSPTLFTNSLSWNRRHCTLRVSPCCRRLSNRTPHS